MTSTVKRVTEWLLKSLKFSRPAYVFVGLLKVSLIWILLLMDSFMKIKLRMSGHVQDN